MDLGLKNKVALVTGAGSQKGFGKGTALILAKEGCKVIVADIDLNGARQTAAEIEAQGGQALAVKADITQESEVNEMVQAGVAKFGPIDILVNNAGGIFGFKLFADKTADECDTDINLNFKGAMNCIRAVVKPMIARKSGKIINISSIGANKGTPPTAVYNGAKAALIGLTKSLAVDLGHSNINVNCIAPGFGLTNFGGGTPPKEIADGAIQRIPLGRSTTPQDIGNLIAFLASDVSSDITGQNIGVDGGEGIT
jgi:3-oxoacyl-[acyl-carrier protein] reductase